MIQKKEEVKKINRVKKGKEIFFTLRGEKRKEV
jgi:hypothetical protein